MYVPYGTKYVLVLYCFLRFQHLQMIMFKVFLVLFRNLKLQHKKFNWLQQSPAVTYFELKRMFNFCFNMFEYSYSHILKGSEIGF